MGQNQTQPSNEYEQNFEEVKLSTYEALEQARKEQKEELYIAKKLGMTEFEITIERGPWDLEIIINYIQRLKMMKCTFELECDREVFAVNKEDGTPR